MTLTQNVDPNVYKALTPQLLAEVSAYIDASMTATTFPKRGNRASNHEIVTSEIIYYWMVSYNIPFECQKWHLSRLLIGAVGFLRPLLNRAEGFFIHQRLMGVAVFERANNL